MASRHAVDVQDFGDRQRRRFQPRRTTDTEGLGATVHRHTREDEAWIVLDGEVTFFIDDGQHTTGPGTYVSRTPRTGSHPPRRVGYRPDRHPAHPRHVRSFPPRHRTTGRIPHPPTAAAARPGPLAGRHGAQTRHRVPRSTTGPVEPVAAGPWTPLTGRFCARDESARNAGGTPGCGTADGAARRTRGTQIGSPPVPAGPLCQHRACGAPAQREASAALAMPVRTRTAGTRVRTVRTGSLAPRPAPCHAAAVRAGRFPHAVMHPR